VQSLTTRGYNNSLPEKDLSESKHVYTGAVERNVNKVGVTFRVCKSVHLHTFQLINTN
jgi:hypothetical protein